MEFFKTSAEKRTDEKVIENVHYVVHTDKNGVRTRVYNLDNPDLCKRTGIIELQAVRKSRNHDNNLVVSRIYDNVNDITIGIPNGVDIKTGSLLFKRINVRENRIFDLSNLQDAQEWAVIKHHKKIDLDGSKTKVGEDVLYKVYDKEAIAERFMVDRNVKRKAITIAEGLYGTQLRDFAISIGIHADSMSPTSLSMHVIQYAEKEFSKFIDIWENPNRHQNTILKKALALTILTHDVMLGICFNGLPLGSSEQMAVQYLKDNIGLCTTIEQLIQSKEGDSFKTMPKSETSTVLDSKDAENKMLKDKLEAMEKKLAEISKAKIEEIVDQTSTNIIATDEEHKALLLRAKNLKKKIQGVHLIKDKDLLRKKIEEAESVNSN